MKDTFLDKFVLIETRKGAFYEWEYYGEGKVIAETEDKVKVKFIFSKDWFVKDGYRVRASLITHTK